MDVDEWMEEQGITPEQFDEWVEMDSISPLGNQGLASVIALGNAIHFNRLGSIMSAIPFAKFDDIKTVEPSDLIPWQKKPKSKRKKKEDQPVNPKVLTNLLKQKIASLGE